MKGVMKTNQPSPRPTPSGAHHTIRLTILLALLATAGMARAEIVPSTTLPKDASASLGGAASFQAAATTDDPPLSRQWQHNGTNLEGATIALLRLTNITELDAGEYRAIYSDAAGHSATSRVATLTIDPTFTKITAGPIVTDTVSSWNGSWGDYDSDGRLDLAVFGDYWNEGLNTRLYRNDGNGGFHRMTINPFRNRIDRASYSAWADFENDGDLDLFVTAWEGQDPFVYVNQGKGQFIRQTADRWWTANRVAARGSVIAWGDYDADGFVDAALMVASQNYPGGRNALLHNEGDGTFTAITNALNTVGDVNEGCAWVDYDGDGDVDLIAYRSLAPVPTQFYRNDGGGKFVEATPEPLRSEARYGMGGAWGDFDNDGDLDLFFRGYGEPSRFYLNNGDGTFVHWSGQPAGLTTQANGNAVWGDYDNDGWLDLFVSSHGSGPRNRLYRNLGNGEFEEILSGSPVNDAAGDSIAPAWVDYDGDGALDLFVARLSSQPNYLYRNNGNTNRWLEVKLKGVAANRSGIGARIFATATIGGKAVRQMRQITAQSLNQELVAHFGLGDATIVDVVRVEWPSGNVQELTEILPDQVLTVTESVKISPTNPLVVLGKIAVLSRAAAGVDATYQWRLDGIELAGKTTRILRLTNVVAADTGRYSVVVSNTTGVVTNFVYLRVYTPQFTKVTEGPVVQSNPEPWGCAWGDYNDDGYIDLFVANGGYGSRVFNCLYRNNRDGTFTKSTTNEVGAIVGDRGAWGNVAWADYNNDGALDLMVSSAALRSPAALYRNQGDGRFDRITDSGAVVTNRVNWGAPCWADYDNDGWVDLLMVNGWNSDPAPGTPNLLAHNEGDGTFTQINKGSLVRDLYNSQGGGWSDLDGDGDLDVIVEGDGHATYRNDGGGKFVRLTEGALSQEYIGGITPAFGDYDNDGRMDVFFPMYNETSQIFHNEGDWKFTKILLGAGGETGFGAWADYDNDGDLDLFITTGQGTPRANLLYRNNGDGTFAQVTNSSLVNDVDISVHCAWGDYDNDGFLDLYVPRNPPAACLLHHNNGNGNHWLLVKLIGTKSNRSAIGAKVRVRAAIFGRTLTQMREVSGGNRCQNDLRQHFGLGNATNVATLRIEWPSGTVQELANVAPNQIITIWEPPALKAIVQPDGGCALNVRAEPNRAWQIQASNDLLSWQTLASFSCATMDFQYGDTAAAGRECRFYRVICPE